MMVLFSEMLSCLLWTRWSLTMVSTPTVWTCACRELGSCRELNDPTVSSLACWRLNRPETSKTLSNYVNSKRLLSGLNIKHSIEPECSSRCKK
uniref:Putative secreted protein n=1 Tax=Anopheles triannulatus TaxID=58253 RepID=A0A2M4B0G8_9DIPT